MMSSGMSPLCAVDVLGDGRDLVLGEAAERVLHHLEVGVEVAGARRRRPGRRGTRGRGRWRTNVAGAVEGAGLDAPLRLAAEQLGRRGRATASATKAQVMRGLERRPWRRSRAATAAGLDRGGGVGEVVGEHLVGVGRRRPRRAPSTPASTTVRGRSRRRSPRRLEVGGSVGHRPAKATERRSSASLTSRERRRRGDLGALRHVGAAGVEPLEEAVPGAAG